VRGAGLGDVDGDRAAKAVRCIAGIVEGAHAAALDLRRSVSARICGVLVATGHHSCRTADAGDGLADCDSHRRGCAAVRFLRSGRADLLSDRTEGPRGGSGHSTHAGSGDRLMSTARANELAVASRAGAYIALTKPDVSFLVLI